MTISSISPVADHANTVLNGSTPLAQVAVTINKTSETGSSDFRRLFQTEPELRKKFSQFLNTIFFQLDEKKVFKLIDDILSDTTKSDEQIYNELIARIDGAKKTVPMLSQLWALSVLKKGMGEQASSILEGLDGKKFNDYLEVYDRRYVKTLQKMAALPLKGQKIAFCDSENVTLTSKIEAGSLFSKYPYTKHIRLNDADCTNPLEQPEKTHIPIPSEVKDQSLDLISCLGGLHHVPKDRQEDLVSSFARVIRPGGVVLFRDHDVINDDVRAMASVVHTFVNAADKISWNIESKEIRDFKSLEDWTDLLKKHGFIRIAKDKKVLKDDPTENGMIGFIKAPQNLEELKQAALYRKNFVQPAEAPKSTRIEWGNVRFSQRYADFIQDHHAYAFDYMGHLRQHWTHYKNFIKECKKNPSISFSDMFFSENGITALFILLTASVQLSLNYLFSLPSQWIARCRFGSKWREVANLTTLEKFQAKTEKEYASFILHTPYYEFPWLKTIQSMWKTIWNSEDKVSTKLSNSISAIGSTLGLLTTSLIAAPSRMAFGTNFEQERAIEMIIQDPQGRFEELKRKNPKIECVFETQKGHKLIRVPRYTPMTELIKQMSQYEEMEIVNIANHDSSPIDLKLAETDHLPQIEGSRLIYELPLLQDREKKRYAHYEVKASSMLAFIRAIHNSKVEYIHE